MILAVFYSSVHKYEQRSAMLVIVNFNNELLVQKLVYLLNVCMFG